MVQSTAQRSREDPLKTQLSDQTSDPTQTVRLAYYAADGTPAMPLLRPLLIAGIVASVLVALLDGGIWVAAALSMIGSQPLDLGAMLLYFLLRGAVSAVAVVLSIGLIGCLRLSAPMRLLSLGAAATLVVLVIAATLTRQIQIGYSFGRMADWRWFVILLLTEGVQALTRVLVPGLLWYILRRADVRALFVRENPAKPRLIAACLHAVTTFSPRAFFRGTSATRS